MLTNNWVVKSHPIPPYKNVARALNDTRATLFLATMPSDYYSAKIAGALFMFCPF